MHSKSRSLTVKSRPGPAPPSHARMKKKTPSRATSYENRGWSTMTGHGLVREKSVRGSMHHTTSERQPPLFDRPKGPRGMVSVPWPTPPAKVTSFEAPHQPTTANPSHPMQGRLPWCSVLRMTHAAAHTRTHHEVRSTNDRYNPPDPKECRHDVLPPKTHARPRHEVRTTAPANPSDPKGVSPRV